MFFVAFWFFQPICESQKNLDSLVTGIKGPGTYKILKKDSGPIRIPFKMQNGKPLMNLEINGKKVTLMIDNGVLWDQVWLAGSPLVDELGLKPIEETIVGGAGEGDPAQAHTAKNLR